MSFRPAIAGSLLALLACAGCTVQPLYGTTTASTGTARPMAQVLASVEVNEPQALQEAALVAQELRNHLIFLLGRGGGQPASPRYTLDLTVTAVDARAASVQRAIDRDDRGQPTASVSTVRATFTLRDAETREVISTGTRLATASYDLSLQEFAALRASRDAHNRAAREVAAQLHAAVAQAIVRPTGAAADTRIISAPSEIEGFGEDDIATGLDERR